MSYVVFDIETTYGKSYGRVGNRWDGTFGLCAAGFKTSDRYTDFYTVHDVDGVRIGTRPSEGLPIIDLSGVTYLVGHNIKFDLLWYWDHPEVVAFLKRGGKIWDTMYAEYLLSGQFYSGHNKAPGMKLTLKDTAIRRGCTFQKLDIVAALWKDGVRTEDVDESILLEYQKYDVLTTEEVFIDQVKQARSQGQMTQIQQRMEGLLAICEMEFNGMHIDQKQAAIQQKALEDQIAELDTELNKAIPSLPEGCEFKWSSWRNVSALLFGGYLKYEAPMPLLGPDGEYQYYLKKIRVPVLDKLGRKQYIKSGKNKGKLREKWASVPDIERGPKTKLTKMFFELEQMTPPKAKWESSDSGYYSTSGDIMEELAARGVDIAEKITKRSALAKDLGTYYMRENKGKVTGMLTNIQPTDGCVHGELNHCVTITTRLSSSNPNLQNIPAKGKSEVKRVFTSRFPEGVVSEKDYSQLEVVCKGVLSGDEVLLQAIKDGIDEHCEWLAFCEGMEYDTVIDLCKVQELPDWQAKRQSVKPITFGEKYGAGVNSLSIESGVPADTIKAAIERRKVKYAKMYQYDEDVMDEIKSTRKATSLRTDEGYTRGVGFYRSPTGTIFSFLEVAAMEWQQDQGIMTAFPTTCVKNYPSQGLGGEITEVQSGRVFRKLLENDLRDDIKMMNTVHDAVYFDYRTEEICQEYAPKIAALLEDVSPYFSRIHADVDWDTPFPIDVDYGNNLYNKNKKIKERNYEWVSE